MMKEKKETPFPPGVLPTIAAGFELVSKQLWLLVIPVALDAFLWLGMRLGAQVFMDEMITFWQQENALIAIPQEMIDEFVLLATRTNVFAALSVPLIGVPTFMAGITPEKTPISTAVLELGSVPIVILFVLMLSVLGVFLTAVYYNLIAHALRGTMDPDAQMPIPALIARVGQSWLMLLLLGIVLFLILLILYIPLMLLATVFAAISPVLGGVIAVFAPVVMIFAIIQFIFVPHALILHGRPLANGMIESSLIIRKNLMATINLFFTLVLINYLMNSLLLWADDGSWLTAASIVGHAFVSTGLVTAVFIFYHDRFTLLDVPQEA